MLGLEIDVCVRCGGTLRIIASLEEPPVIARILAHLQYTGESSAPRRMVSRFHAVGYAWSMHAK